jgi:hypothetical protein
VYCPIRLHNIPTQPHAVRHFFLNGDQAPYIRVQLLAILTGLEQTILLVRAIGNLFSEDIHRLRRCYLPQHGDMLGSLIMLDSPMHQLHLN